MVLGSTAIGAAFGAVVPAPLHPIDRVYPLVTFDSAEGEPSAEDWAKAYPGESFFANGVMEAQDARTVFRMLADKDRLYVRIACAAPAADDMNDSVEFYVTQSGRPDFPCIAVILYEDGEETVGLVRRARTWWIAPEIFPLDETVIPREARATETGWEVSFSLPFDELDIPREGFRFNIARGRGLAGVRGTRFAWCDLGGRMHCTSNQFNLYATAMPADEDRKSVV